MSKTKEYNLSRKLRKGGISIKEIAKKLGVSKGSVSVWCNDIVLKPSQIKILEEKKKKGGYIGGLKGAKIQKDRKIKNIEDLRKEGMRRIGQMSNREVIIAGIALYWGEGSKGNDRLQITNSDPEMIKFFVHWVNTAFNIEKKDLIFYITVNNIHKKREKEIKKYWINILNVSIDQFRKTVFISSENKKKYSNFKKHYGTLRVTVRKSSGIRRIVQGMIEAMFQ